MGWPQYVVAALLSFEVIASYCLNGWPRPPISFQSKLLEIGAIALLLHAGGFWK